MKQSSSSLVTSFLQHGSVFLLVQLILIAAVSAQPPGPPPTNEQYPYARFTPSMAIIIVVLIAALFFMGFFSIYIRHCSDSPSAAGSIRRALSMRARRAAASRGLDASVIETFPTFTYSEVKGKRIGKGALECAVCINEFEDDETLRLIPKCDHAFHPECIDTWLESHVTCPVCRANLSPEQPGDEVAVNAPPEASTGDVAEERAGDEIVVQVDDDDNNNNGESNLPNQGAPPRAWSVRRPKVFGFGKFRSHSTGHSVVQPGENLDRFTLKLPAQVRKEVMDRAALNRTSSCAVTLPREGSSRRGPRLGGEGSSRAGRYLRMERSDRQAKSDRWVFFTRGLSMRSPKVVATGAEKGEGSTSKEGESRAPVRMPSLKCLEPKADGDEARLVSGDSGDSAARPPV